MSFGVDSCERDILFANIATYWNKIVGKICKIANKMGHFRENFEKLPIGWVPTSWNKRV